MIRALPVRSIDVVSLDISLSATLLAASLTHNRASFSCQDKLTVQAIFCSGDKQAFVYVRVDRRSWIRLYR